MKRMILFVVCFLMSGTVFCGDVEISMLKFDFNTPKIENRKQGFELKNGTASPVNLSGYSIAIDQKKIFTIKGDFVLQPGAKQLFYFDENDKNQIKLPKYNQTSPIRMWSGGQPDPQYSKEESASLMLKKLKEIQNNFPDQIKNEAIRFDKESLLKGEWSILVSKITLYKK